MEQALCTASCSQRKDPRVRGVHLDSSLGSSSTRSPRARAIAAFHASCSTATCPPTPAQALSAMHHSEGHTSTWPL